MEDGPELAPLTPSAFSSRSASGDPNLSNDPPNHDRSTLLERENQLLRRRLREAEKEMMEQRTRVNGKTSQLSVSSSESRRRLPGSEVSEESVRRAMDTRDEALLELRRQLQMLKLRLGKEDEAEEVGSEDMEGGGTIHTGDTSYESAEDEEEAGPVRESR